VVTTPGTTTGAAEGDRGGTATGGTTSDDRTAQPVETRRRSIAAEGADGTPSTATTSADDTSDDEDD